MLAWLALVAGLVQVVDGRQTYNLIWSANLRLGLGVNWQQVTALNFALWKLIHVGVYFVLSLLLWRVFRGEAREAWRGDWARRTFLAGVALAALDEFHQHFQAKHAARLADVAWDALGVALALGFLYWRARRAGVSRGA